MFKYLLITANVGSLFNPDERLHNKWIETVSDNVGEEDPDFLIIHLQETGGKKFAECSKQVPVIIHRLRQTLSQFIVLRAYVDIDYESLEYTALGVLCFVKTNILPHVSQYNFQKKSFEPLAIRSEIIVYGLETYPYVVKHKFPKDFWPSIKWGRKGYMQTRWKVENRVFDFVNAHLFHDESNLALIHENPEIYSQNRKRALDFVIKEMTTKGNGFDSLLFIFGDLNFRLDLRSFLNRITEKTEPHAVDDEEQSGSMAEGLEKHKKAQCKSIQTCHSAENLRRTVSAIEFRRENNSNDVNTCVLRIEKKRFDYFNHKKLLDDWQSYLEDDKEVKTFQNMHELKIDFPPTYPWSEDPEDSETLMKTRAPAWCDRILMNSLAFHSVGQKNPVYKSFGMNTCTGDHKPVMLSFKI